MNDRIAARWTAAAGALLVVFAIAAGAPVRAEPEFLASSAAGMYELAGETILKVERLQGWIMIRAGGEGHFRFLSTDPENRSVEVPVDLWKDGRTLILGSREPAAPPAVRMEVAVPPGFSLDIELFDSRVTLANIYGDLRLKGERLDAQVNGVDGDVALNVRDSTVQVGNVTGDVELDCERSELAVTGVQSGLTANILGGRLEATGIAGSLELDGEDAAVILDGVQDAVRVDFQGGSMTTTGVSGGGLFRLQDTGLQLKECGGDIRVESDAAIGFADCKADLHFDVYGAPVNGTGNQGILEIKTDDAGVVLRKLKGATRVQGDRLQVDIQEVEGELWVLGSSSSIKIDNVISPLKVENEFGDVHILAATRKVDVASRDGNVTIERQTGPVHVTAEGERVTVAWTSMHWKEDSVVDNAGGDVSVYLPAQGGCSVDASASYGRVETDIEDLVVGDDGSTANGTVNRSRRPVLKLRAEGDIRILKAPTVANQ